MKNIMVVALATLVLFAGVVSAQDPVEKRKIEYLISAVADFKGAKFIRNGTEHQGREAAEHLRMKYRNARAVATADDFIQLCASRSSITGEPYRIRLPEGKTITAEEFFREKLKKYDQN